MKHTKKIIISSLVFIMGLISALTLVACGLDQSSPENLAKVYVRVIANSDSKTLSKIFVMESADGPTAIYVNPETKVLGLKFVKYEKISGDETTEVGKITVSYQKDGAGDRVEETEILNFKKIEGKWYIFQKLPIIL